MPDVLEARRAYKQADADALLMRARARAKLGRAVEREIARGTTQEAVARTLEVVTEQVRRYRQAYRDWQRDHPGESLDD